MADEPREQTAELDRVKARLGAVAEDFLKLLPAEQVAGIFLGLCFSTLIKAHGLTEAKAAIIRFASDLQGASEPPPWPKVGTA